MAGLFSRGLVFQVIIGQVYNQLAHFIKNAHARDSNDPINPTFLRGHKLM